MTFRENINRLCAEKGTTLTAVVKSIKGSSSFVTSINNGSLPKEKEMVEMAQILGCTVLDFFADEGDVPVEIGQTVPATYDDLDEDELEVIRLFRTLTNRERHLFMAQAYSFEEKSLRKKE